MEGLMREDSQERYYDLPRCLSGFPFGKPRIFRLVICFFLSDTGVVCLDACHIIIQSTKPLTILSVGTIHIKGPVFVNISFIPVTSLMIY
jgi:hypothetical protein